MEGSIEFSMLKFIPALKQQGFLLGEFVIMGYDLMIIILNKIMSGRNGENI
jgi:hypothetical protein